MKSLEKILSAGNLTSTGESERELVIGGNVGHWEERCLLTSGDKEEDQRCPKMLVVCSLPGESVPYLGVIVDPNERSYEYARWAPCCSCWVSKGELCNCESYEKYDRIN